STGEFVEFTSTNAANSIVVRNSIPDAPSGGGVQATISLYANDVFVRKLTLSSKHSWLYGTTDDPEGLTNTPGADARRLFDESHALLSQSYPAGTKFRLQRDAGDTASFYIIDLIDLEQVAPPAAQPAGCVSITNYGAVPNDGIDDTDAIQRAVTADQKGEISCVWIPAGQWRQEQKILTDDPLNRGTYNTVGIRDVTIRGAGMWHSQLYTLTPPHQAGGINHPHEGNFGFDIDHNTQISDIAIFGSGTIRGGDGNHEGGVGLNGRFGKGTKISNVWIEHANVGVWAGRDYSNIPELWGPGDGVEFSGMRIRNTYADGINFANGTRNSTVFNSSFRNNGDDALAVWASKYVKDPSVDIGHDNHFRNNTIQLPWRANGIAVYGGFGNTIENNVISDTMNYPGIMLATDHDPLPFSGQTLIANNALYRTGGAFWNEDQEFGAITLFAQGLPIPGVTIRDTDIVDSTYDGIQFKTGGGEMPGVKITNVRIDKSNNGSGILAMSGARGSATLSNVTITNSAEGNIRVEPGSRFVTNNP
ncbi:right-handed parallel beta-helix repeat-containing protein, partial [Streptomyces pharetrae]|uniref:right-handed parallel beta-helix repeat-containing protein n=1 Tax=Streptomyces pharetrae TaxID=291370 RepID=UPI0036AD523E